jgi:ABC-type phosphate transport system substrate-binding protein
VSKTKKVLILGGVAAAAISLMATAAVADPPSGTTPRHTDIVGTGSDTTQFVVDQLATDYDAGLSASARHVYSFDAVDPSNPTGSNQMITEKTGCDSRTRPNGSGAGIAELEANLHPSGDKSDYCVDFARSSSGRASTDPASILYLPFAIDGVTWSADTFSGKTNAPTTLSTAQLNAIYSCNASLLNSSYPEAPVTWKEVGGSGTKQVVPVIPQSSSGTRKFFLKEIGVTTLGSCVQGQDNSVEENEGTNAIFQSSSAPNIVFPYSTAVYLAQSVHNHNAGSQGDQVLKRVGGVSPTVGTGSNTKINSNFPYLREVYNVVRNTPAAIANGTQAVPTYLQAFFGTGSADTGWVCKNLTAKSDIESFGFLADPNCGKIE